MRDLLGKMTELKLKLLIMKNQPQINDGRVQLQVMDMNFFPAHAVYINVFAFTLQVYDEISESETVFSPSYFNFNSLEYHGEFPKFVKCYMPHQTLTGHVIKIRLNDELCQFIRMKIRAFCANDMRKYRYLLKK